MASEEDDLTLDELERRLCEVFATTLTESLAIREIVERLDRIDTKIAQLAQAMIEAIGEEEELRSIPEFDLGGRRIT
jgi:hypothetical protein